MKLVLRRLRASSNRLPAGQRSLSRENQERQILFRFFLYFAQFSKFGINLSLCSLYLESKKTPLALHRQEIIQLVGQSFGISTSQYKSWASINKSTTTTENSRLIYETPSVLDGATGPGWSPVGHYTRQKLFWLATIFFFPPKPCTYTSSPLDGMAKNYFIFYMDTQDHAMVMSGSILFLPPTLKKRQNTIWSKLESNPGPLASQAITLTTRPWLLGLEQH